MVSLLLLHPVLLHLGVQAVSLLLGHPAKLDSISRHPHSQALLQPAVLAAVSAGPIDQTVLLPRTGVGGIALLTSPEKALAAFTRNDTIMDS